tara:strand:- start:6693 stop:7187 length:495 start_codon:yes stop_codon:yes gene_type:complete
MVDKSKLKKLRPADRVKKLKKLQEESEKESTEIEELLIESEKEAKTEKIAEEITPQQRDVEIGDLFDKTEDNLENQVKKDKPDEDLAPGYIPVQQQYSDYEKLKDILPYASSQSGLTEDQVIVIDEIGERLDTSEYKTESKKASEIHVASIALHHKIRKYAGLN